MTGPDADATAADLQEQAAPVDGGTAGVSPDTDVEADPADVAEQAAVVDEGAAEDEQR